MVRGLWVCVFVCLCELLSTPGEVQPRRARLLTSPAGRPLTLAVVPKPVAVPTSKVAAPQAALTLLECLKILLKVWVMLKKSFKTLIMFKNSFKGLGIFKNSFKS